MNPVIIINNIDLVRPITISYTIKIPRKNGFTEYQGNADINHPIEIPVKEQQESEAEDAYRKEKIEKKKLHDQESQ